MLAMTGGLRYSPCMPEPIRLTVNAAVSQPDALATWTLPDFETLAAELEGAREEGTKEDCDLLVPSAAWSEMYRKACNIEAMSRIFVGDVDGAEEADIDALLASLDGVSCILYTTHSHMTPRKHEKACYRVIVELDKEYPPALHESLWQEANRRLGGLLDPDARTPEQGYYLPAYPPGFGLFSEVFRQVGLPWRVSEMTTEAATPPSKGEGVALSYSKPPPSTAVMIATLNSWIRGQQDPEKKLVGQAAKAFIAGKNAIPLGEGNRNAFLITLAGYLAHQWPHSPPDGISDVFGTMGWDLFNADGKYPLSSLSAMIERLQGSEQENIARIEEERTEERRQAILRSTAGARDSTITDEEREALGETYGVWREHTLALHKKDIFFLRPDGTYDPGSVMRDSLFVAARDRLAVFGDHIEYAYEDEQGKARRKTEKAFLEEYATVVRNVVFDMTRPRGGWDAKAETILFPAAAPAVEPVGHEDVHNWLELLGDSLIDMLACIPHFDRMLPALVLTGPAQCGKTVLAKGIGRAYGSDPLDSETAFGSFNAAAMTKQPIILMDEKVSEAYRKEGTTLIRRFLTQGTRLLDEKYQARVELRGYPRLIIAANNLDVLNTREEMSSEDRAAFSERLVHADLAAGQKYLLSMRDRIQPDWIDRNHLAEHILYLAENWEIRNRGVRFYVAGNHTRLHDGLASRSGYASDIAYWLLSYVTSPERVTNAHLPIIFDDKGFRVNVNALVQGWGHYLKDHKPPSPSQISRALKSLSTGKRQKLRCAGKNYDAYQIDPLLLRSVNEQHQVVPDYDQVFGLEAAP